MRNTTVPDAPAARRTHLGRQVLQQVPLYGALLALLPLATLLPLLPLLFRALLPLLFRALLPKALLLVRKRGRARRPGRRL